MKMTANNQDSQKIELEEDPGVIYLDAAAVEEHRDSLSREYALPALQRL